VVYSVGLIRHDLLGEFSAREHERAWAVNVVGAVTAAAHVAPRMAEAESGTIILTGGMPELLPGLVSLSRGKAGLRALAVLLDRAMALLAFMWPRSRSAPLSRRELLLPRR
jgi:NADP-dependent 3-hydroxy acid dehydrogenase YdfG